MEKRDIKDIKENKGTVGVNSFGLAETAPRESGATVSRITNEAQAKEFLKDYKVPENSKVVLVTEDKNVFWQENESSANNHAQKNNLKLFRIVWDSVS